MLNSLFMDSFLKKWGGWFPVLASLVLLWPVVRFGIVYDDLPLFQEYLPRFVGFGDVWNSLEKGLSYPSVYYRPLVYMALLFIREGFGVVYWPYHLAVLLLHAANVFLVFEIGLRLFKSFPWQRAGAVFAGLLFALHPIQAEVVSWISGMVEPLCSLFFLLSLRFFMRHVETFQPKYLVVSAFLFLGSLLSKEMAISLLLILPVYYHLFKPAEKSLSRKTVGLFCIFFGAALSIYFCLRHLNMPPGATPHFLPLDFGERALRLVEGFGYYLYKTVFPLSVNPYIAELPETAVFKVGAAVLSGLFFCGVWFSRKRNPHLFFVLLFFGSVLAPGLLVAWTSDSGPPFAERYLYLPTAAFAWGLAHFLFSSRFAPAVRSILILSLVGGYGYLKTGHLSVWKNPVIFWAHAVKQNPEQRVPWASLGSAYLEIGQPGKALQFLEESLRRRETGHPLDLSNLYLNLGVAYHQQKMESEAMRYYSLSNRVLPNAKAFLNTALLHLESAQREDWKNPVLNGKARESLEAAFRLDPRNPDIQFHLRNILQEIAKN